jgi:hypothetical protein
MLDEDFVPSFLLQSLIPCRILQAMLMQQTGRMRQCWRYNTVACQVGASVSHQMTSPREHTFSVDDYKLLHVTLIRSYAFNAALSANIYQPACSARVELDRSVLDTQIPEDAVLDTLLSFAKVQEVMIQEARKFASHRQNYQMTANCATSLRSQMKKIRLSIEKVCRYVAYRPLLTHLILLLSSIEQNR